MMKDTGRIIEPTIADLDGMILSDLRRQLSENPIKYPAVYMTENETALMLGITLKEVNRLVRFGILISYTLGKKQWFKKHEIQNALTILEENKTSINFKKQVR